MDGVIHSRQLSAEEVPLDTPLLLLISPTTSDRAKIFAAVSNQYDGRAVLGGSLCLRGMFFMRL